LGYDAAVVRGGEPLVEQVLTAAPDSMDACLDNVGGEHLQALAVAREGMRIALIGALSGQLAGRGTGRTAPVTLDAFQLLVKKICLRGYSADDDPDVRAEWMRRFGDWLRAGRIRFPHAQVQGWVKPRAPSARPLRYDARASFRHREGGVV